MAHGHDAAGSVLFTSAARVGRATSYGPGLYGNRTASGRVLTRNTYGLAHKKLPMGTWVRVQDPRTGISLQLEVIDRGPFRARLDLDITEPAVRLFGYRSARYWGVRNVKWEVLVGWEQAG